MQKLTRFTLSSGFFILLTFLPNSLTQAAEISSLASKLQNTFNNRKIEFSNLFSQQIAKDIKKKYYYFLDAFPDAQWIIKPSIKLKDNRQSIDVLIIAERNTGIHKYSLESNQKLGIKTEGEIITGIEVLSDCSILQSGSNLIEITIKIPDIVLTGSKYDVDIILDKPLGETIIAGGLIAADNKNYNIETSKDIILKPIPSGGIFKTVIAPLEPGKQRWSALIAHPNGLISITKLVRVVSSTNNLISSKS